ncbi:E3 ubiquitin-protein ligase RNF8-like [Drosophila obscura]|uniref:E3 ubiquitin-protein ligase RNF8-like n=1 Tax=Drosophila obscura TaxID=7282 RepID=UPI001BB1542C|nr:E3 ubiquitin-protein ligase RNF8-like [Drosophila obscura]
MEGANSAEKIPNHLEDPFQAEEFKWLSQWTQLNAEQFDVEAKEIDEKRSKLLLHLKNVHNELDIVKANFNELTRANGELKSKIPANLREDFEKQIYKLQFVQLQKEQLTIERDGLLLHLQQEEENYESILQKLEDQSQTMAQMNKEFQREISECKRLRGETLSALEQQEQNHSLEMVKLKQTIREKNLDDVTCSICLCPWELVGVHRLVSLACGHIFGAECISACLNRMVECPICRKYAHPQDIRFLYDRNH